MNPIHVILHVLTLFLLISAYTSSPCFYGFGRNEDSAFGVGHNQNILKPSPVAFGPLYNKKIISIAAGFSYSTIVDEDNNVYSFGSASFGGLGFSGQTAKYYPTLIPALSQLSPKRLVTSPIVHAGPGYYRTFVKERDTGFWYGFGMRDYFALGDESLFDIGVPSSVFLTRQRPDIVSIVSGAQHTIMLAEDGSVFAVGDCSNSQCGVKNVTELQSAVPLDLTPLGLDPNDQIIHVCAGMYHTLALTNSSVLIGWGDNTFNLTGAGVGHDRVHIPTRAPLSFLHLGEVITKVSAGSRHNLLLTSQNRLLCFGEDAKGQCGVGAAHTALFEPTEIDSAPLHGLTITDISCGYYFSLLLTTTGELFHTGENIITDGPTSFVSFHSVPISHLLAPNEKIATLSSGFSHALLLTSEKRVLSMGLNREGCLGIGNTGIFEKRLQPIDTDGPLKGAQVTHMRAIQSHIYFLDAKGTMTVSGTCAQGQCMDGSTRLRTNVESISQSVPIYMMTAGGSHSLFVSTDGQLYGSGMDTFGQMGIGVGVMKSYSTIIDSLRKHRIIYVGASDTHSIVQTAEGLVFGMGNNIYGQTGCGCTELTLVAPTPVVDASGSQVTNVLLVEVGPYHNFLLVKNGTLLSWGYNTKGRLGSLEAPPTDQSVSRHAVPVHLSHLLAANSRITRVSAGFYHSLALSQEGDLICWGSNEDGACGMGEGITIVYPPQRVPLSFIDQELVKIIDIAAGYSHSLLLASNGKLYSCGDPQWGATGTGRAELTMLYRPTLVDTSNMQPINESNIGQVKISAGDYRSFISLCAEIHCGGLSSLHPEVCSLRGQCIADDTCTCTQGYGGPNCEFAICGGEWNTSRVCSGHGECIEPGKCECVSSYDGALCKQPSCFNVTQAAGSVCFGRGKCIGVDTCECASGFHGPNCEQEHNCHGIPQSSPLVCSGNGKCLQDGKCECDSVHWGESCQLNMITAIVSAFLGVLIIVLVTCVCSVTAVTFRGVRIYRRFKRVTLEKDMTRELLQGFIRDEEMDEMDADSQRAKFIVKQAMMEVDFSELKNLTKIATGGSGAVVFKAEWHGDTVAVKVFRSGMASSQDNEVFFKEFEHELSLMSSLRHRNVISFLGCSLAFPRIALICEFCSQGSVEDMILKGTLQTMPSTDILRMLLDIAEGVAYLHSREVIHRDLKCANVLVDQNSVCRITDFGLAKYTKEAQNALTTGIGTSYYIAPEMWNGDGTYSVSVDVYSFGILAMEMLLGRMCPFPGADGTKNVMQVQSRAATDPLYRPDLSELPPKYSFLKWMLQACWDEDSTKRPPFRDIVKILKSSLYDVEG